MLRKNNNHGQSVEGFIHLGSLHQDHVELLAELRERGCCSSIRSNRCGKAKLGATAGDPIL